MGQTYKKQQKTEKMKLKNCNIQIHMVNGDGLMKITKSTYITNI